jgi:hypothetical protein
MMTPAQRLERLRAQGFDKSKRSGPFNDIRCSQCAALVINGTPTHETGCPNAMHECRGCNELVPMRVKYCDDCR